MTNKEKFFTALAQAHNFTIEGAAPEERARLKKRLRDDEKNMLRFRLLLALDALVCWASDEGAPDEHLMSLRQLQMDLNDVNDGKHPKNFQPSPRDENSDHTAETRGTKETLRWVTACVLADVLHEKGAATVDECLQRAARVSGLQKGALESWRKHLKTGAQGQDATQAYDAIRSIPRMRENPIAAARVMFKGLK